MTLIRSFILGTVAALVSLPAFALNFGPVTPSYDLVLYSLYKNGDKPVVGCSSPSGWTVANKGTGTGQICEQSASEFDFVVLGNSAQNGFRYAYKSAGTGDFQITARVTNEYLPLGSGNFAGLGLTASDGTGDTDYALNCYAPFNNTTIIRGLKGIPPSQTGTNGAGGQVRPRYMGITYDDSLTDARCWESSDGTSWSQVNAATHDFGATPLMGVEGQSGSLIATFQGTLDHIASATGGAAITIYTPSGGGGGVPVYVPSIGTVSCTQNAACAVDCDANWTGATSYSFSGLPTGMTQPNAALCEASGTVTAVGTASVSVTATNATGSASPQGFSIQVAAASGDVFTIPDVNDTTAATYDCDTANGVNVGASAVSWDSITPSSVTLPGAGDTIQFEGGTRGEVILRDCVGSFASPITVTNRASDSVPLNVTSAGAKNYAFRVSNDKNIQFVWQAYSGCVAGPLGRCNGITIQNRDTTPPVAAQPDYYLRIDELSCTGSDSSHGICRFENFYIDAKDNSGGIGGCYSLNDHRKTGAGYGRNQNPGLWRENVSFIDNYGKFCGAEGEGMYIGPNQEAVSADVDIPLRSIAFDHNRMDDSGRECINVKSVFSGTNVMTDNICNRSGRGTGQLASDKQNDAYNINTSASWTVARNHATSAAGNFLQITYQNVSGDDPGGANTFNVENNFDVDSGQSSVGSFYFMQGGKASTPSTVQLLIRSNTSVSSKSGFLNMNSSWNTGNCASINNIAADDGAGNSITGCADNGNRSGTIAAQDFVNSTVPSGDFHLKGTSTVCGTATANVPTTDYDGDTRPEGNGSDQGADEATACP